MKWPIIFLMILMSASVYAAKGEIEVYRPGEVFDLGVHLTNITGDVTGATCNVQIRNESYIVLDNFVMNEIGNGFYNATYNTSRIGKFFCRQNCTQGTFFAAETCDFVIEGDEKLAIAITLLLLFVISAYLVLVIIMSKETFSVHGAVKVGMLLITIWFLLIPMDAAIKINEKAGDLGISSSLDMMFIILIYLNVGITFYFIVFMIVGFVRSIQGNLPKEDQGEQE